MTHKRDLSLDILRIIAAFLVVVIHVAAGSVLRYNDVGSNEWWWANVYDGVARISVPLFFAISGLLLLSRPRKDIKEFYRKRASRVVVPFVVWSVFYLWYANDFSSLSLDEVLSITTMRAFSHFWFLYYIIGLYVITPLLWKILTERRALVFTGAWLCISVASTILEWRLHLGFSVMYFIIGPYISQWLARFSTRMLLILFVCASLATVLGTHAVLENGVFSQLFYNYSSPSVIVASVTAFEIIHRLARSRSQKLSGYGSTLVKLSGLSLGIYLVHPFIIREVFTGDYTLITTVLNYMPSGLYFLVASVAVFSLSALISQAIRWIPRIGRWLV